MAGEWSRIRHRQIPPLIHHRFIAILLVVFRLNAEQALEDFIELGVNILEKHEMDAQTRMAALRVYINKLLEKYELERDVRLLDANIRTKGSKMCVIE